MSSLENRRFSHYEVGRFIARGAMGEVYEGFDLHLERRRVAMKFIAPAYAGDPRSLSRFRTEALAASRLIHPRIATVLEFHPGPEPPCIVMEYLGGGRLRERMTGPADPAEAMAWARAAAEGLAVAHAAGIVHRDIKPENLMFDEHETLKITDFGLARALFLARSTGSTLPGSVVGSPFYIAPEALSGPAAAPADVYSLGVVLYEALAGRRPFVAQSLPELFFKIVNEDPPPLRVLRPDLPEAVVAAVEAMMARDPGRRPGAAAVASGPTPRPVSPAGEAISERAARRTAEDPPPPGGSPPGEETPGPHPPDGARPPRPAWWKRRWAWAAAAVVAIGAALAAALALREDDALARAEALRANELAVEALGREDWDLAARHLAVSLGRRRDYAPALINLGQLHLLRGFPDSAAIAYTRVLALRGAAAADRADAHYQLGSLDLATGNWEGAARHFEASAALDSSAGAFNNRGYALVRLGQPDRALALLRQAIARFPGRAELHANAGLAALALGDTGALVHLDAAVDLDPALAPARGYRAMARARRGDRAGARADWEAYLRLDPDEGERAEVAGELRARAVLPEESGGR